MFRQASDAQAGDVKLEAISQPLYDAENVVTGASTTVFFQNPAGRSRLFTNLETTGSLTWPKRFSVKAFRLVTPPSADARDVFSILSNGWFTFRVGEKDYFVTPNFLLTPGVGIETALITGAAAPIAPVAGLNYGHNGRADHRNLYTLQHSIWIPSVQNFRGQMDMVAANVLVATASVYVFLEGEYFREIQ
jgi:hypothetical protein